MILQFWFGAAALSVVALGFLVVPLWRQRKLDGRWSLLGSVAAGLLVPSAVGLYLGIATWNGQSTPGGNSLAPMAQLVEGLDARLQQQPDDPAGWFLLGQSYMSLNRFADARRAFREALARDPMPALELKLALGEAEVLSDPQSLLGDAGRIFEDALEIEPDNPTALWYGGLAASATQRPDVARRRWSRLLQLDPPQALRDVLQQHLNALGEVAEAVQGATQLAQTDVSETRQIRLRIRIGDGLGAAATIDDPAATLFIFARAPQGGPPVAVIREAASALPGEFSLSDADSMLPGRSLADFDALTIIARISASGQPAEQPGDLFGEHLYSPEEGGDIVDLVIDQIVR